MCIRDRLDGLPELKICTGYRLGGKVIDLLPMGSDEVADCEPILETMVGWSESTVGVTTHEALPAAARAYLARIEALCETPIDIISTGPERDETILRRHPLR